MNNSHDQKSLHHSFNNDNVKNKNSLINLNQQQNIASRYNSEIEREQFLSDENRNLSFCDENGPPLEPPPPLPITNGLNPHHLLNNNTNNNNNKRYTPIQEYDDPLSLKYQDFDKISDPKWSNSNNQSHGTSILGTVNSLAPSAHYENLSCSLYQNKDRNSPLTQNNHVWSQNLATNSYYLHHMNTNNNKDNIYTPNNNNNLNQNLLKYDQNFSNAISIAKDDDLNNPYKDTTTTYIFKPNFEETLVRGPLSTSSNIKKRSGCQKCWNCIFTSFPCNYLLRSWKKRTDCEKCLILTLSSLLLTIIILSLLLNSYIGRFGKSKLPLRSWIKDKKSAQISDASMSSFANSTYYNDCLRPECISISARLLNSMNLSVDPCTDFYEYACGGWIDETVLPDGQTSWNTFQELFQKNQYILRKILERKNTQSFTESELKAKTYYESCLDENDTVEYLGAAPLLKLLSRYGSWNLTKLKVVLNDNTEQNIDKQHNAKITNDDNSNNILNIDNMKDKMNTYLKDQEIFKTMLPNDWNFQDRMERISRDMDLGLLFSTYVSDDDKNSSQNVIFLDMGKISLPKRDYYLNASMPENVEILTAYLKYMIGVAVVLANKMDQKKMFENSILYQGLRFGPKGPSNDSIQNNMSISQISKKNSIIETQKSAAAADYTLFKINPKENSIAIQRNRLINKKDQINFKNSKSVDDHRKPKLSNDISETFESGFKQFFLETFESQLNTKSHAVMYDVLDKVWFSQLDLLKTASIISGDTNSTSVPNFQSRSSEYPSSSNNESIVARFDNIVFDSLNETLLSTSQYAHYFRLVTKTMTDILAFETKIANFTPLPETLRDGEKNYNPMTIRQLQQQYDFINWKHYLNSLFSLVNYTLTEDSIVIVRSTQYMTNLTALVKEYLASPQKQTILNNYFMWHITSRLIQYLSQDFRSCLRPLTKALKGSFETTIPWKACMVDTNNIIGFPLGSLYVKETFKGKNKFMAENMINGIKEAFKDQLPTLDWMDSATIKVASEKADAIRNKIGFPDFIMDGKKLDGKYKGLSFESDQLFNNNLRQIRFFLIKSLERIKKPVDKTRWSLTPPTVNAYYLATGNEMVFPAGILQSPFYDSNFPKSLNFGAMGFVVGHELTHGFDDHGRQFDKNGNLKPWWNNASIAKFNKRAQCLEKQYSQFKLENLNINGKQTIGENIADNGGLKATFAAFQNYLRQSSSNKDSNNIKAPPSKNAHRFDLNGADPILPGMNLTQNQLFFLAFAQVWCSVDTKKSLYYEILNDSHSPNKIRVLGTLSNSIEFSKAYQCPLGSVMNPVNKCVVW